MRDTKDDVRLFAQSELTTIVHGLWPNSSVGFQERETNRIVDRLLTVDVDDKSPIFLWVAKMIDTMKNSKNMAEIESILKASYVPNALYTVYARIIARIEMTHAGETTLLRFLRGVLCWAVHSHQQPLQISTLSVIARDSYNSREIREIINEICGSLFVWRSYTGDENDSTLHFVHFSVKEFLCMKEDEIRRLCADFPILKEGDYRGKSFQGQLIFSESAAHRRMFDDCMHYLTDTEAFGHPLVSTRGDAVRGADIATDYPFFAYAAHFWPYHLSKTGSCEVGTSIDQLQKFLRLPNRDTWIEGAIALGGGVQWLRNQKFIMETWLNSQSHACADFSNWAKDIDDSGFEDYEPTLRYNSNDIHFLDSQALFSRLVDTEEYVQLGRDVLAVLDWDPKAKEKPSDDSLRYSSADECIRVGTLSLPAKRFPYGEHNEEYGFIQLDQNRPGTKGVFLIDKRVNDPRLLWYCVKPEKPIDVIEISTNKGPAHQESKTEKPTKVDGHMLWLTISGAVDYAGSVLAAVFAETVPATASTASHVRLKPIIWQFHAENEERWKEWSTQIKETRRQLKEATRSALNTIHSLDGRRPSRGNCNDALAKVKKASQDLISTMKKKPALPSIAPLYSGREWATCFQLQDGTDNYPRTDILSHSRYLLAFQDDTHLVTYKGIWDIENGEYIKEYGKVNFATQFVVLPGGDDILRFQDTSSRVLEIVDSTTYMVRAAIPVTSFGKYERFGEIVDCSRSGRLVAATLEDDEPDTVSLAVLDLYQYTYKIIVSEISRKKNFKFLRAFFCPKDMHVVVTYSKQEIEEQFGANFIDIPRAASSELNFDESAVAAVLYSDCSYRGGFHSISGQCLRSSALNPNRARTNLNYDRSSADGAFVLGAVGEEENSSAFEEHSENEWICNGEESCAKQEHIRGEATSDFKSREFANSDSALDVSATLLPP
jgi:hypothetical protein